MKSTPSNLPTHDEITQRAQTLWEQAGRPEGRDTEHWLQAERELRKEREQAAQVRRGASSGESSMPSSASGKNVRP
jgi:hypothetical protein